MRVALTVLAATLGLAAVGCGGDGDPATTDARSPGASSGEADRIEDERVVLGWTRAVREGDFERAGEYFSEGAVVEQGFEFRLDTQADAVAFSRGLPCRARVTEIEPEAEGVLLASFDLLERGGGRCPGGGTAAVRFVIRAGAIEEWRQLPPPDLPEGDVA